MPNDYIYTRAEFLGLAESRGLSQRGMRRLIENRLFPRSRKTGLGRAKGCKYVYPAEAADELEVLIHLRQQYSDFGDLRWHLWLESDGWEWLWDDLKIELLAHWKDASKLDVEQDSHLDEIDQWVVRLLPTYSRARRMKPEDVGSVLWAGVWLRATGQLYPYTEEDGSQFWRAIFRRFYGNSEADTLMELFAPAFSDDNVRYVLQHASAGYASRIRALVINEYRVRWPKMPFRKSRKRELERLKCLVVSSLVLQYVIDMAWQKKEVQKAVIQDYYNNAVAVLVTPDGVTPGKEVSECKEILPERDNYLKTPSPP